MTSEKAFEETWENLGKARFEAPGNEGQAEMATKLMRWVLKNDTELKGLCRIWFELGWIGGRLEGK